MWIVCQKNCKDLFSMKSNNNNNNNKHLKGLSAAVMITALIGLTDKNESDCDI